MEQNILVQKFASWLNIPIQKSYVDNCITTKFYVGQKKLQKPDYFGWFRRFFLCWLQLSYSLENIIYGRINRYSDIEMWTVVFANIQIHSDIYKYVCKHQNIFGYSMRMFKYPFQYSSPSLPVTCVHLHAHWISVDFNTDCIR